MYRDVLDIKLTRIKSEHQNNTLLNNEWVNEEIKEEIKKSHGNNENTTQNIWDAAKVILRVSL